MLTAYFDESGTHRESKITAIAGFIGDAETWGSVTSDWHAALAKYNVDSFHMAPCEAGRGEFATANRETRLRLPDELSDLLCRDDLFGFGVGVVNEDWQSVVKGAFLERFPTPYSLCFEGCIQQLLAWMGKYNAVEPVRLVFAEQNEYRDRAKEVHENYRRDSRYGAILQSFTFEQAKQSPPLQAADMLAYETYRYLSRGEDETPSIRPVLSKFIARNRALEGWLYDREGLDYLVNAEPVGTFIKDLPG